VFEAKHVAETEESKHFDGGFLFTDEFSFEPLESEIAGKLHDFADHRSREAPAAVLRQHQHANPANMPFPAAELLMQGGVADDFAVRNGEQREVAAEINVLAPLANHGGISHAMLDEHAFLFRHSKEEIVEFFFVVLAQRAERALKLVFESSFFRELLNFKF